jgi:uncharacterized Zn finger protein (UPF0148 family)
MSVLQTDLKDCPQCHAPLIEIDHFGERLVGCMECNTMELAREPEAITRAARRRHRIEGARQTG